MKSYLQNFITRIPREYEDEFLLDIYQENLLRAIIAAIVLIIAEIVIIIFFKDQIYNTEVIVYSIIIFNILSFPVLSVIYKKNDSNNVGLRRIICLAYLTGLLVLFCALAVVPQDKFGSINTYVMAIFGIAAIMYISPIVSLIIYSTVYTAFFFVLPLFQPDELIVTVLRINAFIMNVFAWVLSRLVFRMKILSFTDKKIIEQKNMILKEMVIRDPMTSLLNHDNAYKKLNEEIKKAKRIGYALSIIMVDIDNFKYINDHYGHQVGDDVIISVANLLVESCRGTDIICRYGGEEYMLILPDTALDEAAQLAERIRMKTEATEFANGIRVTVSGGISEYDGESTKELIYRADQQLYKAKYNGKNRFSAADEGDNFLGNPS